MTINDWILLKTDCFSAIQDIVLSPEQVLKGYACEKPLELECSFKAYISLYNIKGPIILAKFFVVRGTNVPLLSYKTAMDLKLINFRTGTYSTQTLCTDCHLSIRAVGMRNEVESFKEFPKIPIEPVKFAINHEIPAKQIIRYCIPKAFEKRVNERLFQMEFSGIIERADEANVKILHVSPLILTPKGTDDFRIVIDYREVNKSILRQPYPMPSLEKIWTNMPNSKDKYFTKLDLKDAYFHVELHRDVRQITTFMTANGLFRFKRFIS